MTTSSQRQRTEENGAAQIAGAAVLGMTLAFGFMTQQGSSATIFSLFQEGNWFRESGALLLLRVAVLGCFLFIPFQRRLYAIAGFFLVISWVTLFSVVGAFILPLATSCAFFYFAFDKSKSIRKTGATIMLAMPFLLSAIQKMHPDYLRGHEFSPNGSFTLGVFRTISPHQPSRRLSPSSLFSSNSESLLDYSFVPFSLLNSHCSSHFCSRSFTHR